LLSRTDFFVVVLGMSPTGLNAVRELGNAGIDVYVADVQRQAAGYSNCLKSSHAWIVEPDSQGLIERLAHLAKAEGRQGVLVPTSDKYIEFVVENGNPLSDYKFQQSYSGGLYHSIVDKGEFALKCKEHGISHPGTWTLAGSGLASAVSQIRFPCILKPTLIHLVRDFMAGQKVLIIKDKVEYLQKIKPLEALPVEWMVQEIIPGPESNITLFGGYFDLQGRLRQAFTCRKLRQYPAGFGSASLVQSEALEETTELSEKFLKSLGFKGIAGTEFKYDERDQELKIIEINPRPTLWFGCSTASGKTIVLDAVHDLLGQPALPDKPQNQGIAWCYSGKDIATRLFYFSKGDSFVLPHVTQSTLCKQFGKTEKKVWAVFSMQDPLPVVGELLNYVKKIYHRFFKRKQLDG